MENYSSARSARSYNGRIDSLSFLKTSPRERGYMPNSNSNTKTEVKKIDENVHPFSEDPNLRERSQSPRNTSRLSHPTREFLPIPGNPQGIFTAEQFILLLAELERLTMINRGLMQENRRYFELRGLIPLNEVEKLLIINKELNEVIANLQKKSNENQKDSFLGDASPLFPHNPKNQNSLLASSVKVSFKDDFQKDIESMQKQLGDLQREIDRKSKESDTLRVVIDAQKKEISALTIELESTKKNTESLQQNLDGHEKEAFSKLNEIDRLNKLLEAQKRQTCNNSNDVEVLNKKTRQLQTAEKTFTSILRQKEVIERKYYERELEVDGYKKKYEDLLLTHQAMRKDIKLKMEDLESKIKILMSIIEQQQERIVPRFSVENQYRGEILVTPFQTQDDLSRNILTSAEGMKHELELKLIKDLLAREKEEEGVLAAKLIESKQAVTHLLNERIELLKLVDEAYGAEPGSQAYNIEKRHIRELQQLNDDLANMFEKQTKENADLEMQLRALKDEFEQLVLQAKSKSFVSEHILFRYMLVCAELQRVTGKAEHTEKQIEKLQNQIHIQLQLQLQHQQHNQKQLQHQQPQQLVSQQVIVVPKVDEVLKTKKVDQADKEIGVNLIVNIEKSDAQTDTYDLNPRSEEEIMDGTDHDIGMTLHIIDKGPETHQNIGEMHQNIGETHNELDQENDASKLSSEIDSDESDDEVDDEEFNKVINYRRGGLLSEERRLSALMQMKRFEVLLRQIEQEFKNEGVLEMNMVLGIDCTASNHYSGKRSFGGKSLHAILRNDLNPYEQAFGILGSLIEKFDSQGNFPVYLFGARDCAKDDVIPLWVDKQTGSESLPSIDMVLRQYRKKIKIIKMGGYTTFVPLIHKAIKIATEKKKFIVLIILGDGGVTDVPANVKAIIDASTYPIGIIFVGLGDGDYKTNPRDPWHFMKQMEYGLAGRKADNFTFVTYRPGCDPNEFAKKALLKVPRQLLVSHLQNMIEIRNL